MRAFEDESGRQWETAVLGASYGCITLLFSAVQGHDIRQLLMAADNQVEAEAELVALEDDALRTMLAKASPWDPGQGSSMPLA